MLEQVVEPKYIVYKHTNKYNEKCYIGISSQSTQSCARHNGKKYKKNKHFYASIQKCGWDNFSHEILIDGLSIEEAQQKEIELILQYKSNNFQYRYNLSFGGGDDNIT